MKNVILLDNDNETGLFHALMLNLSGFRVTEIRTPAEAIHRILTTSNPREPFGLLLVSNFTPSMTFSHFVEILRQGGFEVPILIIDRPENPPAAGPGIFTCQADDVPEKVMELFAAVRPPLLAPSSPSLMPSLCAAGMISCR